MDAIRKIIEHHFGSVTIDLPEEYNDKKVEVIVLPLEDTIKKYNFSDLVGKLQWDGDALSEQKKLRDEWD